MKKIFLPAVVALLSFSAVADSHNMPFMGVHLGYSHQEADSGDRDGVNTGVKGLYSFQGSKWFFDPGLGFQIEALNGHEDILTTSAFGEVDARYKFSDSFSFGPMTSLQFGGNQSRNDTDNGSYTLWLAGVRGMIHMNQDGGRPWRIEMNVQRSFAGDDDNELYSVNLGVQFGFPWEKEAKPAQCAPCVHPEKKPDVQVRLRPSKVHFDFDSAEVKEADQNRLGDLSRVIKKRQQDIELIRVEGHADERGSHEYNQNLSERRAMSVKNQLVKNGIMEKKIEAKGYGETRPRDTRSNEAAWAKNRRTDIKFYGLKKDTEQFKRELREASSVEEAK